MKSPCEQGGRRETRSSRASESRTPQAPDPERDSKFRALYRDASYYSAGRNWGDYAPAYRYGQQAYARYRGQRFEDIERRLEQGWEAARARSRLVWVEARGAVHDAWRQAELEAMPHGHGIAGEDIAGKSVAANKKLHS